MASAVFNSEDAELYEVACRTIRIAAYDSTQRKIASRYCAELIAKAVLMERRTARAAVRAISNLSKASNQELASALLHHDAKPIKILIKAISSRYVSPLFRRENYVSHVRWSKG